MDIISLIAKDIKAADRQVEAAVKLIDEGNTIPFIARYRKEATGSLDDEQLRLLAVRLEYLRSLEARKQEVIDSIESQGKLTGELKEAILKAEKLVTVEDLYRPYKQKKKTRAEAARKRGLKPLADSRRQRSMSQDQSNRSQTAKRIRSGQPKKRCLMRPLPLREHLISSRSLSLTMPRIVSIYGG